MHKKNIPLTILEKIQEYIDLQSKDYIFIDPQNHILRCVERDINSDFRFVIEEVFNKYTLDLLVQIKPFSASYNGVYRCIINFDDLDNHFISWSKLLKSYEKVKYFTDDQILNGYISEYCENLGIIEDTIDYQPLRVNQLYLLNTHLKNIESSIIMFKNEWNSKNVTILIADINVLRKSLTTNTRITVLLEIARIWGVLTKLGLDVLEQCLPNSEKEIILEALRIK